MTSESRETPSPFAEALKAVPIQDAGWHHLPALREMFAKAVAERDERIARSIEAAIEVALWHEPATSTDADLDVARRSAVAAFITGSRCEDNRAKS